MSLEHSFMDRYLHYEEIGSGDGFPLVILHGLFGSLDNWKSFAKVMGAHRRVVCVDLRNHGESFHANTMTYDEMTEDVTRLMDHLGVGTYDLMGHSMGGKVAMGVASVHLARVRRLVVVDIAPKTYPAHHQDILVGLRRLSEDDFHGSRRDADGVLAQTITEERVRQFLLKSYVGHLFPDRVWQFNVDAISQCYPDIMKLPALRCVEMPTLFVKGALSDYIVPEDEGVIGSYFSHHRLVTIPNAGHWVHAESPRLFLEAVQAFLD